MQNTRNVDVVDLAGRILASINHRSKLCPDPRKFFADHKELLAKSIDPSGYDDVGSFMVDYLAVEICSKYPYLDVDVDRELVAMEKFRDTEKVLQGVDKRLQAEQNQWLVTERYENPVRTWCIRTAREKICRVLGPFNWADAEEYFAFGPGASVGCSRKQRDRYSKIGKLNPTVTTGCIDLAYAAIRSNPHWFDSITGGEGPIHFNIVRGNKVITVPKNAKTDRVIAVEPLMNMYFQKGIGGLMRRSLKKVGVNLDDQVPNQVLARQGSIDNLFATIDLSSASDSISMYLTEMLLPSDWVTAIKLTRSPVGVLPSGEYLTYQKVSSMGNGFTFELESLIFWAVCSAVYEFLGLKGQPLRVYGDDLVVHTRSFELVVEVLEYIGFTTNRKKTFASGPFRESCGKHYFRGVDVTPFYFREKVEGEERLLWAANTVKAYAFRLAGAIYGCDSRLKGVWDFIVSHLSNVYLLFGPLSHSGQQNDQSLGVEFDEACPSRAKFQHDGWQYGRLIRIYASKTKAGLPGLALWHERLRGKPHPVGESSYPLQQPPVGILEVADGVSLTEFPLSRYKLRRCKGVTPQWESPGPWLEIDVSSIFD